MDALRTLIASKKKQIENYDPDVYTCSLRTLHNQLNYYERELARKNRARQNAIFAAHYTRLAKKYRNNPISDEAMFFYD